MRVSKHGTRYAQGSEHKWPDWVTPPVICGGCGQRVTLKHSFFQSYEHGTFHVPACAPYAKAAA